jgi:monoamine oxidase
VILGTPNVSRRRVLAGLGGFALSACSPRTGTNNDPNVVVVGAGLAGLAATYELRQAGLNVRLVEQSARPGGRVHSVRGHFDSDAVFELGGTEVASSYTNFLGYCEALGVAFEVQANEGPRRDVLLHEGGDFYSLAALRSGTAWPNQMSAAERAAAPFGLLGTFLREDAARIGTVERVMHADFSYLDDMTLRQYLVSRQASLAAIEFIDRYLNYNSVDTVSALGALRDVVRRLQAGQVSAVALSNGNSSLPEAFASRVSDIIQYRSSLQGIDNQADAVSLRIATASGDENWQCDHVILALPFSALRHVDMSGNISAERHAMIDELPYTQISRTYLQTASRFWEQGSSLAAVYTDGPLERFFDLSDRMPANSGLLQNWLNGVGMQSFSGFSDEQRVASIVEHMQSLWPGSAADIQQSLTIDWGQTYCKGAYAHFAPGQVHKFVPTLSDSFGRLHFAGEHTEFEASGLEGALISGRRAASQVLAAMRP